MQSSWWTIARDHLPVYSGIFWGCLSDQIPLLGIHVMRQEVNAGFYDVVVVVLNSVYNVFQTFL